MRISLALFGFLVALGVIVGVGTRAIHNVYAMSATQAEELNSEIDRIVAEYHERKRSADVASNAEATMKREALRLQLAAARESSAATPGSKPVRPAETSASNQKTPKKKARAHGEAHAGNRQYDHLLPVGFLSLPKFSAYTLLGLRDR